MKLLITGAGGFLGKGLIFYLEQHHELRLMDVVSFETRHELMVGDVADPEAVGKAVEGVDALVIAHMAPNRPEIYAHPSTPFDVNVKGTANLFAAAVENKINKVVLISSTVVVAGYPDSQFYARDLSFKAAKSIYSLTKILQEEIAQYYHLHHGTAVAILRPAYVHDADTWTDKYGRKCNGTSWTFIDRRDIGKAAHCALQLSDLGCEVFYVLGHPDSCNHADMDYTYRRLNWKPDHDFSRPPMGRWGA